MERPQLSGKNLEIFYSRDKCNWDFTPLLDEFEKYQQDFFDRYNIKKRQLNEPIKAYFVSRSEWDDLKKDKSAFYSFYYDKNFDYPWEISELIWSLINKTEIKNSCILDGITDYYGQKIVYGKDFEKAFEHLYIKKIINPTFASKDDSFKKAKSFVVVKYLLDNNVAVDWEKITEKQINEYYLSAKKYYDKKFDIKSIPKSVDDIKSISDVLRFRDKNMCIGYVSKDNEITVDGFKGIHTNYRLQSPQEALSSHVGTCAEYAGVCKYILDKLSIESKIFYFANYDKLDKSNNYEELSSHFAVFFRAKEGWINIEAANMTCLGIKKFEDISDGVTFKGKQMYYRENFDIYEIDTLPFGCDYVGLYDNCAKNKRISYKGDSAKNLRVEYGREIENSKNKSY